MLTKTTETALRALMLLAVQQKDVFVAPRRLAEALDASPTYLSKILNQLAKADLLRTQRGPLGGCGWRARRVKLPCLM